LFPLTRYFGLLGPDISKHLYSVFSHMVETTVRLWFYVLWFYILRGRREDKKSDVNVTRIPRI